MERRTLLRMESALAPGNVLAARGGGDESQQFGSRVASQVASEFASQAASQAAPPSGAEPPSTDTTLAWATCGDAADDAGMSRVYGGIHFDNANTAGKDLGRKVGALVFDKAQRYWTGLG